ncbi:hypothetical protein GCM10010510_67660 [Streptomyces anandii JCM 4720]|nr:hypothetical protein GCM10010510_67660 [Streptomyces anandii JCM 4720]
MAMQRRPDTGIEVDLPDADGTVLEQDAGADLPVEMRLRDFGLGRHAVRDVAGRGFGGVTVAHALRMARPTE